MYVKQKPLRDFDEPKGKKFRKNVLHILSEKQRQVKYEKNDLRQMCKEKPVQRNGSGTWDGLQGF